jgi:uncharacterized protein (TIGR02600 family)
MTEKHRSSEQGVALIIVLSLVAVMAMLAMVFFSSTTAETQTSQSQSSAQSAQQLASSAAQIVMSQIQVAGNQTAPGNGTAVAWTSQPGLLRTFTVATPSSSASTVYKLYSANNMVATNYTENEDAPPSTWKSSPAIYCDLNAPVARGGNTTSLAYPIADPSVAGVVPGFTIGTAPGYSGSNPSPTNNPLPMPVRWLYVLKNGQLTTPSSMDASGNVTFSEPQPSAANPVVGRIAFWADDETCKVNINTAGYAKNDSNYWTFWDTPVSNTTEESTQLSSAQPWTNEFLRYPGHPATTGLNVVFGDLNLTPDQIANLTPRYKDGGSKGGSIQVTTAPTSANIADLKKNQRMYPTVDEFFYDPVRSISNSAGISASVLEQRRFMLTSTSRAPETTLFDTPRVTIWPTWQTASKRTPTDKLIAFCSTIAGQPFYFMRENPMSTRELLDISDNLKLYNYIQKLTERNLPGPGGNFLAKYTPDKNRDQILTSIFDAIRLANLDDRSGPESGASQGWSFTAGPLSLASGRWTPTVTSYNVGYVAPPEGPNGTRGAGRASTLAEVALMFGRSTDNSTDVQDPRDPTKTVKDNQVVSVSPLYGFAIPTMGMILPGQNRKIEVDGLDGFSVTTTINGTNSTTALFPGLTTWSNTQNELVYKASNPSYTTTYYRRNFGDGFGVKGGLEWTMSCQKTRGTPATGLAGFLPPTGVFYLPYLVNDTFTLTFNRTITINGTNVSVPSLSIRVFSPASSTNPLQTFEVAFPPSATLLTPMGTTRTFKVNNNDLGRWGNNGWEDYISDDGDTIVAMQSRTGDHRSEILRPSATPITDFRPHNRFGDTTSLLAIAGTAQADNYYRRRASSLKYNGQWGMNTPAMKAQMNGNLVTGNNTYGASMLPALPAPALTFGSIQADFPPGDFNNGPGNSPDGSWLPKTDEGRSVGNMTGGGSPYFRSANQDNQSSPGTLTTPNRQMPSAVYFGSVPTGVFSSPTVPWRTLLFRPGWSLPAGGPTHFGATSPPDWFLLDFFHMPIVEPYAISEPFSTAGKINMNARMVPFSSYITRETALHALLTSTRVTAIPDTVPAGEQAYSGSVSGTTRWPLSASETLKGFNDRYDGIDGAGRRVFLTAGEICSLDLVPQGSTKANLSTFWADKRMTGDNNREAPYSTLAPRLTTKSNSYTVHVTAQALAPGPGVVGWQEGRGKVLSEWRGAYTIERYVDPNDARFTASGAPNFLSGTQPVGPYYRFRVLGTRRFNP